LRVEREIAEQRGVLYDATIVDACAAVLGPGGLGAAVFDALPLRAV